jgi:aspartyl-tRNA(Asn)/glutamyl-tRNA(Gln) amidotransferase subunit B
MKYIPTIGLEIHAELKTASKMFCSCPNNPDEERPNTNVCPICLGHPGTLPVLNKEAIRNVIKVGLAVDGSIADFTEWDRKNYFYPDIPKGYQISQYKYPLVSGGSLGGVALERIHLEEDTAQSTHDAHENSLVNFNRSGVPLMELVTKPVIHDADTAMSFAKELQLLLRALGAGEANMEKGEMRVEANISIASEADTAAGKFGTKTEVKNLNSFRSVGRAIAYEVERQAKVLESGGKVSQETRGWDDAAQETFSQRSKESSHDYRYFPDPDIPKLKISEITEFSADVLRSQLPELPWAKRDRYKNIYKMTDKEVAVLVEDPLLSKYFESTLGALPSSAPAGAPARADEKHVRTLVNYLLTDYVALLREKFGTAFSETDLSTISPARFAELVTMIVAKDVSSAGAKELLRMLMTETASPKELAKKHGLIQSSDASSIAPTVDKIIADNAKAVAEYKAGKTASLQFLLGQAMKATKGSANPEILRKLFIEKLS